MIGNNIAIAQALSPIKGLLNRFSAYVFISVSILFILIGRSNEGAFDTVKAAVYDVMIPVINVVSKPIVVAHQALTSMSELAALREENSRLRQENEILAKWQATALKLDSENAGLRKMLNFIPSGNEFYISSRIINDSTGPFTNSAFIGAGGNDGVKVGMAVVNHQGLVGRVIESGSNSSRVMLITDINSRIPVMIQNSRERAIMMGDNVSGARLIYLSEHSNVGVGDVVVTSGDGGVFPSGIPVGIVESQTPEGVILKPIADINSLEYVSIVDFSLVK